MSKSIASILIANRGEIACRVIRTARRMGLRTIAVYSDADAGAAHVALADEAVRLGPAPARDSYLKIDALLDAARRTGADAIHPGYGFLSENAAFADACAAAGVIFIGPPADAIRAMGSKSAAKALMDLAGVPLVPGYHGQDQSPDLLAAEADRIGYPVLIKASAGGGGKGMKVVRSAAEFPDALASAQREAEAAFGDGRVLVEKYLTKPRHIEVQVFADTHGNAVYLFERDCSIQRRHQKVVEEAPAPGLTEEQRARMGKAAVDAARAVNYVGAGTVEFIAEDGAFYFMEMNTRLQVEHPVTEAITGQDLVEWQIRVARGEALPLRQDQLSINGHAMEVRLYAEDPARDFLPQTGRLAHLRLPDGLTPEAQEGVRVDSGIRTGDAVSIHYDPMIAKIIAHGRDRTEAARRLARALAATEVAGLVTNRAFLRDILVHPAFLAADLDTGFIARHQADLLPSGGHPVPGAAFAAAALAVLSQEARQARGRLAETSDPHSPWAVTTGWRLNRDAFNDLHLLVGDQPIVVRAHFDRATQLGSATSTPMTVRLDLPGQTSDSGPVTAVLASHTHDGPVEGGVDRMQIALSSSQDGPNQTDRRYAAAVVRDGNVLTVFVDGRDYRFTLVDSLAGAGAEDGAGGRLTAPMPGKVIAVKVEPGQSVQRGAALMVVEAMKMEHTITAPRDGVIGSIRYAAGDLVEDGAELLVLEEGAA